MDIFLIENHYELRIKSVWGFPFDSPLQQFPIPPPPNSMHPVLHVLHQYLFNLFEKQIFIHIVTEAIPRE